jgi:hypothetical protein
MLCNNFVRGLGTATAASRGRDFHPFAFLTLHTHLAYRLQALGNVIVGRSLSADCPKGQYDSWCGQHFLN